MDEQTDMRMFTSIHTRINNLYRISTIYRKFANVNFVQWGWETIVWHNQDDFERIVEQEVSDTVDDVMEWHEVFFYKYSTMKK